MPSVYCGGTVRQQATMRLVTYPSGTRLPEEVVDGVTYTTADPGTEYQVRVSLATAQHPDIVCRVRVDGKYVGSVSLKHGETRGRVKGFKAFNASGERIGYHPFKLAQTTSVVKPALGGDANAGAHPTGTTGKVEMSVHLCLPRVPSKRRSHSSASQAGSRRSPSASKVIDVPDKRKFFLNPSVSTLASPQLVGARGTGGAKPAYTTPRGATLARCSTRVETHDTLRLRKLFVQKQKQQMVAALKDEAREHELGLAKSRGRADDAGGKPRGVKRAAAAPASVVVIEPGAGAGSGARAAAGAGSPSARYKQSASTGAPGHVKPEAMRGEEQARKRRRKRATAPPVVVDLTTVANEHGAGEGDSDGHLIDLTCW